MKADTKYSRQQLISLLREDTPLLNDGSYQWAVGGMLKSGEIIRTGFDEYMVAAGNSLPEYLPIYTPFASDLSERVARKFPHIGFTMFETVLMNDFLNHLIAQNTIFIQVEKDVSSYIFDNLQEEYTGTVLYRPGKNEFDRYWTKDCIVVLDLISQAPLSQEKPHEITAEKMLVDIIAERSISGTFSPSEIPFVYENVMRSYQVDRRKMNRYAGRRGKSSQVKKYAGGAD